MQLTLKSQLGSIAILGGAPRTVIRKRKEADSMFECQCRAQLDKAVAARLLVILPGLGAMFTAHHSTQV